MKLYSACMAAVVASGLLLPASVSANGTWSFKIENDWAFADDGNYTNGLFLAWTDTPDASRFDDELWTETLGRLTPQQDDPLGFRTWGWRLGQQMWTPSSIAHEEPRPNERPYAGLLFAEASLYEMAPARAARWSLMVGQVGPSSGAEQVQRETHKWFPARDPKGWDYQVKDQLVFQFSLDSNRLLLRQPLSLGTDVELSAQSRLSLGSFQTEARLGGMLRWGRDLGGNFGSVGLAPGYQPTLLIPQGGSNYFVYTGIEGRYRLNDVTLEGNTPAGVPRVDLAPLQASGVLGIVWYNSDWGASWRFVVDSPDFEQDQEVFHGYGGLEFFWRL